MRPLLWIPYLVAGLVGWVIGAVLVPVLAVSKAWVIRDSRIPNWKHRQIEAWRGGWLTWIWGNEEDSVLGATWYREREYAKGKSRLQTAINWSAFRNPTNNMRFIPHINPVIDPKRIQFKSSLDLLWMQEGLRPRWSYTWQGPFAGFKWILTIRDVRYRFWLGWKLKPEDRHGISDTDFRKYGCGFALQFKRVL